MINSNESLTPRDLHSLLRESIILLAERIQSDAARIFNDDFSDDDTDYMPARAATLARFIFIATNSDFEIDAAFDDFRANRDNALDDYQTIDIALPLDDIIDPQ